MAKEKSVYICGNCDGKFPKWSGQCPTCKAWNSITEAKPEPKNIQRGSSSGSILDFSQKEESTPRERISTGFHESNRVFGGGIYPDSLTLFIGNPGIGKSTLALQMAINIAHTTDADVLIFSGEESAYQVISRAERISDCPKNLKITSAFQIEDVIHTANSHAPALIVVDSVQTFSSGDVMSGPGSLPQIRAVTEQLMHLAKAKHIPVLLIGQVNKGGEMAGPQVLAHLVDVVVQFEGDDQHELRILRANKNRFGSTSEVGIFEMTEKGLREVKNPSAAFLSGRLPGAIGSAIFPAVEGERPCLVEIQALTAPTPFGFPKRSSSGISLQRLSLLLAVLEKHAGIKLSSLDVFTNVVGGFRIDETAADLSLCLSIASSRKKFPIPEKMLSIGEIGLSGEIRAVSKLEKRLKEGEKLGFTTAIIPSSQKAPKTTLQLRRVQTLAEAVKVLYKT